jgi:hypothetical protein
MRTVWDFFGRRREEDFGNGGRGSGGGGKLGKLDGALRRTSRTVEGILMSGERLRLASVSRFIIFRCMNHGATSAGSNHAAERSQIAHTSSVKVTSVVWW